MTALPATFDAGDLTARYAALDAVPVELYEAVVTHPRGALLDRVAGVLAWRASLLEGKTPADDVVLWHRDAAPCAIGDALRELGVLRFCRGEPAVVDALLLDLLRLARDAVTWREEILAELRAVLAAREQPRASAKPRTKRLKKRLADLAAVTLEEPEPDEARQNAELTWTRWTSSKTTDVRDAMQRDAALEADRRVQARAGEELQIGWRERVRLWLELEQLFGALGELLGAGWDLARSVLRSQGWLEVARLRALLEQLPAMRELVRALGRMRSGSDESPAVLEEVVGPMRRAVEEERFVRSPLAPTETRGVERSGEIARMLPSEAVLLRHSVLKTLWHARRAERALLTYRAEGVAAETVVEERDAVGPSPRRPEKLERGPVILCVDTSGSMAGVPELVAKAVALEAMRVAHAEQRACYVYAFSGPGDVVEHELALSPDGLAALLAFLSSSFHGGTDVVGPLGRALSRLQEEAWTRADILLVSDGEFPVESRLASSVREVRAERHVRVHGLLIAASVSEGMRVLCDPVHRFVDWGTMLGPR